MSEQKKYPLNGVKTSEMFGELLREYGWEILAEQVPLNCFKSYPTFESSVKFLRKSEWARQRLEAFYLYRYKQLPRPDDKQHQLPPRDRTFDLEGQGLPPMVIALGDPEFFDDPISGPVFPSKKKVQKTRAQSNKDDSLNKGGSSRRAAQKKTIDNGAANKAKSAQQSTSEPSSDPWSKWR